MHFGPYSLLLLVAAANGALLATLVLLPSGRHRGSPWLAALIGSMALRTVPYVLGYAGLYDRHPALTFAPFDLTLAWGPLLWAYVSTLSSGAPAPARWHFAPVALQVAYQLICFLLPLDTKWAWYSGTHLQVVEPVGTVLVLASLGAYSLAAWRGYERWQRWLDQNVSNREESRLGWLRIMLLGIAGTGVLGVVMTFVHHLAFPLDYFARLPIIVALAGTTYLLGLLGYRYGRYAIPTGTVLVRVTADPVATSSSAAKDYATQAEAWRTRVLTNGWHRDPLLTLAKLSTLLDTSPRTLSRTLNEGLGESFNVFINRLRVNEAAERLCQPDAPDVLRVALEAGFSNKASFNRAFKRHTGTTPTDVRRRRLNETTAQIPPSAPMARIEATE
jgi:AraC-like DNA-binding protein